MSEFVLKVKVPIYEMFISASNSYKNNRDMLYGKSPCERYRTGQDLFEYHKTDKKKENKKEEDAKKDIIGGSEDTKFSSRKLEDTKFSGGKLEDKIYAYTETFPESLLKKCVFVL